VNRLAQETSPYLRQHRDNPVDWYPWGDEAFATARSGDKPILLSVGYSACHWCHVMAHESFEDPDVATIMNELFVNIKVDREERPDVDAVYMEAVQAITGRGGWPMTVFLAPDGRPFYGGTYFPKRAHSGMPSFLDVCRAVDETWRTNRDQVLEQAGRLAESIGRLALLEAPDGEGVPGREALDLAYAQLRARFDPDWGGFGPAPKFPQTDSIELLLRAHRRNGSRETLAMVTTTLDAMASGGIYDHLGGGFARYSTDATWLVPHFEKMLYDQALLTRVYLHAWQVTGEARYLQVLTETVDYVLRTLGQPEGGISSAEDADSEGEEGKFYVWHLDEVEELLGTDATAAAEWWGITPEGNFEGATILHRPVRGDLVRPDSIEHARQTLYAAREKRVRPGLDDKVLTEWNALFVSALAEAAGATGRADWLAAAEGTARFLLRELRRDDGRWLRSWQGGRARHLAYAADHAALVDAFIRLSEAGGRAEWVSEARLVADAMLDLFWDEERGGLFTTGRDAEQLITRAKDVLDNATPSANGSAAATLVRLAALTGEDRYREQAEAILRIVAGPLAQHPTAFAHLLQAVDFLASSREVVVTGDRPDLVRAVQERYLPAAVLSWGEPYASPLWDGRDDGRAYVCEQFTCRTPATTVDELVAQLQP